MCPSIRRGGGGRRGAAGRPGRGGRGGARGGGAGGGVAYLLQMLRPVFTSSGRLKHAIGAPLLGEVTLVRSSALRKREVSGNVAYATAAAVLVLLFGVCLKFHQAGSQAMHQVSAQLLGQRTG